MNNNATIRWALATALRAHNDQVDKAGELYILHPIRVFEAVKADGGDIHQQAAAILHDVVEDTYMSFESLSQWFAPAIVTIVRALTRPEGMEYHDYINQVIRCPAAIMVKEADLHDNLGRIEPLKAQGKVEEAARLSRKYQAGLQMIWAERHGLEYAMQRSYNAGL